MYYQKFINFLKEHNLYDEEVIDYWNNNKIIFDYRDDEKRDLIGCFYKFDNNILIGMKLIVPFIDNDKTILINIHEYIHLYMLYYKIGKKCKIQKDREVLPIYYEKLYIKENPTPELINYYQYLNSLIDKETQNEYKIALEISDILIQNYQNKNITKLNRKTKRLIKKFSNI